MTKELLTKVLYDNLNNYVLIDTGSRYEIRKGQEWVDSIVDDKVWFYVNDDTICLYRNDASDSYDTYIAL